MALVTKISHLDNQRWTKSRTRNKLHMRQKLSYFHFNFPFLWDFVEILSPLIQLAIDNSREDNKNFLLTRSRTISEKENMDTNPGYALSSNSFSVKFVCAQQKKTAAPSWVIFIRLLVVPTLCHISPPRWQRHIAQQCAKSWTILPKELPRQLKLWTD